MAKVFNAGGGGTGGSGGAKLAGIAILIQPKKTTYKSGEIFIPDGMIVEATYTNGAVMNITGYTWEPTVLTDGVKNVTIIYAEGRSTVTAEQPVTVTPALSSIAVTRNPDKMDYVYLDTFNPAGMEVTAYYTDGSSKAAIGYTAQEQSFNRTGEFNIQVSYSEDGIIRTTNLPVTVGRASITETPTPKSAVVFDGGEQSPEWDNYDPAKLTIRGETSASTVGKHTVTFTPTEYYQWADGTITGRNVEWEIGKAPGRVSVTPTTVTLDAEHLSVDVTVDRLGDGEITATVEDDTVASVAVDGNTVTVSAVEKGPSDGSSLSDTNEEPLYYNSGTTNITVSVAEGGNYTAPVDAKVEVNADFEKDTKASDIPVGDEVVLNVNGTPTSFIVVNQGNPSASIYDASCDGTWLLMKDCWESRAWNITGSNRYQESSIKTWLNGDFLNLFDPDIQNTIKQVKIPHAYGTGGWSGTNGLSTKVFLLSGREVHISFGGLPADNYDGSALEYFKDATTSSDDTKRVAYRQSTSYPVYWWLRSPSTNYNNYTYCIDVTGAAKIQTSNTSYYIRPCIIFPSDYEFTPNQYGTKATIAALKAEVNQLRITIAESGDNMAQLRADTDYIAVMQGVTL